MSRNLTAHHLIDSTRRARQFILSCVDAQGMWQDFQTLAGPSDEWVSGYIIYALTELRHYDRDCLSASRNLLGRQRRNGGWAYGLDVPADCDSTAWVLLGLQTLANWRQSAIERGVWYLKAHQDKTNGGFSTYIPDDAIAEYIEVDEEQTLGWLQPQPSVTAAAIQALLVHGEPTDSVVISAAARYLQAQQSDHRLWRSYWWTDYGYVTYHSLKALLFARALEPSAAEESAQIIRSRQLRNGAWSEGGGRDDVFLTANNVLTLLLVPHALNIAAARHAVGWLVDRQEPNGNWLSAPILRIPPPFAMNTENVARWRANELGTGVVVADQNTLFTTATALRAMHIFSEITTMKQTSNE